MVASVRWVWVIGLRAEKTEAGSSLITDPRPQQCISLSCGPSSLFKPPNLTFHKSRPTPICCALRNSRHSCSTISFAPRKNNGMNWIESFLIANPIRVVGRHKSGSRLQRLRGKLLSVTVFKLESGASSGRFMAAKKGRRSPLLSLPISGNKTAARAAGRW